MKPFIDGCELPMPPTVTPPAVLSNQGQVTEALAGGAWMTRREIEEETGLSGDAVNQALYHGIRRGSMEREHVLRGATRAITQRYRVRGKA